MDKMGGVTVSTSLLEKVLRRRREGWGGGSGENRAGSLGMQASVGGRGWTGFCA